MSERQAHARQLFAPLGPTYDRMGALLSLGQDPLWRRFLVSRLPAPAPAPAEPPPALCSRFGADEAGAYAHFRLRRGYADGQLRQAYAGRGGHVLDVATGTGLVAAQLLRRGFQVTALDQSPEMLDVARERLDGRVELVEGSADSLPFADETFDHLTFTYLLRYVDDPQATLGELARVVRPGGTVAALEFGLPSGIARPGWELYVRTALPLAGRVVRQGWAEVGDFLGSSIRDFWERNPLERQLEWWQSAGLRRVRVRRLTLGAAVVVWGSKE